MTETGPPRAGIDASAVPGRALDDRIALDDPQEQAAWTTLVDDGQGGTRALSHFRISGVDCAACAPQIEAALAAEPGVHRAEVRAAGRHLAVTWDRARTCPSRLVACIERLGFEAAPDAGAGARRLRQRERRRSLWQLFVAAFCSMQVMMYAVPLYGAAPGDVAPDLRRLLLWASWLLSVPVLLFAAGPWLRGAWNGVRQGQVRMELPVALGIVVAFVASSWAMLDPLGPAGHEVWFDSLTMFVAALLAARWLQAAAHDRVAAALEEAVERVPRTARRLDPDTGREAIVPRQALRVGDQVRVHAGEPFPADGPIVEGETEADESLLTGESRGVRRSVGDVALAGSLSLAGPVVQRVRALGLDTRQAQVVALLRSAAGARPGLVRVADRWAGPFLAGVLLLAALSAVGWWFVDPSRALPVAVAVLIVTCPCALALAAPVAQLAAAGVLARRGILLTRLDALEPAARFTQAVFDKTGTLTDRRLSVERHPLLASGLEPAAVLATARALASVSSHPRAQALADGLGEADAHETWRSRREVAGCGIEGVRADGARVRLGSRDWALEGGPADPAAPEGASWLVVGATPVAWFAFGEALRDDAAASVAALRTAGVGVSLLSGDEPGRVAAQAARLGVAAGDAHGGLTPEAKLAAVARLQEGGACVAMVGDGLNDAPVLARADVSFALAAGSSLARAHADVVSLSSRLDDVVETRRVARRTLRLIRQNLAFAAGYNACMVPLAVIGACPPWLAGLGMAASSLGVVLNALRVGPLGAARGPTDRAGPRRGPATPTPTPTLVEAR